MGRGSCNYKNINSFPKTIKYSKNVKLKIVKIVKFTKICQIKKNSTLKIKISKINSDSPQCIKYARDFYKIISNFSQTIKVQISNVLKIVKLFKDVC